MPIQPGDKLGNYEITGLLGKGGMGEVYRAHDPRLKRDVAIKTSNTAFTERFQREAEAIAALSHPNICTLFDVGPNYLVMELVEGPTLSEALRKGALPIADTLRIASQIADALEAAHAKHIVHRDLKPANVKIRPDGIVKVLDFGLAKVGGATPGADPENSPTLTMNMTEAGMILGTAGYMPPEQARGEIVDHRADIWAFGVVLYELLSGARLYSGPTVSDTLAAVLLKEPDWSRIPAPELSSLGRLLRWCLEKDPKKRLSDIAMAKRLLVEDPAAPISAAVAAPPSRVRFGIAALAGVAVLGLAGYSFMRTSPAPPAEPVAFQMNAGENQTFDGSFAVSPDGRSIAYIARGTNGRPSLYVRPMNSLTGRLVSGEREATMSHPFWSPDGKWIGYGTDSEIKKVEVTGGATQVVCSVGGNITGASWSSDGTIVFAPQRRSDGSTGVWKVSSTGGTPMQLLKTVFIAVRPSFLPDGKHFLFTLATSTGGAEVFVGSTETASTEWPKERVVTSAFGPTTFLPNKPGSEAGVLLFSRAHTLFAQDFNSSTFKVSGEPRQIVERLNTSEFDAQFSMANGTLAYRSGGTDARSLAWLDRTGKIVGAVGEAAKYSEPNLSPDGMQLAVVKDGDIWLLDLARNTSLRFTSDAAEDHAPVWSPDGSRIVFASNRAGHFELYEKKTSNTAPEQLLLSNRQNKAPTSWSPDGKWLVFSQDSASTAYDLMLLSMTESGSATQDRVKPFLQGPTQEGQAAISPDGKWIAYPSLESGSVQTYLRAFPSGENPRKVAEGQGAEPRWRADGRELIFRFSGAFNQLRSVDVNPQGGLGTPRELFNGSIIPAGGFHHNPNYLISSDGQRFLAALEPEGAAESLLTIVLNWQAPRP